MKRTKRWLVTIAAIHLVVGAGYLFVRLRGGKEKPPQLLTVRRGTLTLKVSETGTVQPLQQVEVKSKVSGRIKRLDVDEGDWVQSGQIIAELEVPEIERQADQTRAQLDAARARVSEERAALLLSEKQTAAQLDEAQAALDQARARLDQVRAGPRQQEIAQARSAVAQAKAQRDDARRSADRKRELLAKGFVSQQELDSAQTAQDVAQQALDQAQERLNLLLAGSRPEEIRAAEQEVKRCQAAVQLAQAGRRQKDLRKAALAGALAAQRQVEKMLEEVETRLHDAVIYAPRSGKVIRRGIREGELITSGVATFTTGMSIVTIADLSKMLVKVNLNEVDISKVRVGTPAEITLDALRGKRFAGRVRKIAPSSGEGGSPAEQAMARTGIVRFPVEVEVSNPSEEMRPGMSANVDLILERARDALYVPHDAVLGDGAHWAWLMTPEGLRKRAVQTGISNETYTQIKSGLSEGDRVALHIKMAVSRRVAEVGKGSASEHMRERSRR